MAPSNKWLIGTVSAALLAGAIQLEGFSAKPYRDVADVWTVCYGETEGVVISKTYSKAECDGLLKTKLAAYGSAVLKCVNVPISENEYSAYTLFDYNVGSAAFCGSSLLRKLNAGNHKAACDGLLAWVHADGKFVQGLANRRRFERDLCLKG